MNYKKKLLKWIILLIHKINKSKSKIKKLIHSIMKQNNKNLK